jgi:hypothetical protein
MDSVYNMGRICLCGQTDVEYRLSIGSKQSILATKLKGIINEQQKLLLDTRGYLSKKLLLYPD